MPEFKSINQLLYEFGEKSIDALHRAIESKDVAATRNLLQSIDYDVKIFGHVYTFNLSLANYYKWVDEGTKGGYKRTPPVESIVKWMRAKGIRADLSKRRKGLIRSLKTRKLKKAVRQLSQEKAQRQMAWGIAKNIQKKGIIKRFGYKGSGFYSETITPSYIEDFKKELRKAFKKDIHVEITQIVKDELNK